MFPDTVCPSAHRQQSTQRVSPTTMSCPWLHSIRKVHGSPLTYRVLLRGEHEVKLFVYIFGVYIYLFLQKGFNAPGGILLYDDDISDVVC